MVGGQVMDMDQTGRGEVTDPETLYLIHRYKTGALIKSSARIGAILAGASRGEQAAVSEYASELGLCFQIVDDVLNATSTVEELGKSAGSDAEQGKATFVGVFGLEGARREADGAVERALGALSTVEGDTSGLQKLAYFVRHRES
jgi:geranylgeranyl diphosphate synthase type II